MKGKKNDMAFRGFLKKSHFRRHLNSFVDCKYMCTCILAVYIYVNTLVRIFYLKYDNFTVIFSYSIFILQTYYSVLLFKSIKMKRQF